MASLLSGRLDVARSEPDTFDYALHRQQTNPDAFVLYELYRDRAAWEIHCAGEAVQSALRQFDSLLTEAPRLAFCDTVGVSGGAVT